jgi:hypothetical protein
MEFLQCNKHYTILLDKSNIKNFSFCGLEEGHLQQCAVTPLSFQKEYKPYVSKNSQLQRSF